MSSEWSSKFKIGRGGFDVFYNFFAGNVSELFAITFTIFWKINLPC